MPTPEEKRRGSCCMTFEQYQALNAHLSEVDDYLLLDFDSDDDPSNDSEFDEEY